MDDATLWDLEERFWTGGVDYARSRAASGAVMVFPHPVGILTGEAIFAGLEQAPRWRTVVMTDRTLRRDGALAVLAYRASAEREDDPIHEAFCASTWLQDGDDWRLMAHQQTPAA